MAAQTSAALGWRPATLLVGQMGQGVGGWPRRLQLPGGEMHLNGEAMLPGDLCRLKSDGDAMQEG